MSQIGLEVKTKPTEELTETVEVVEEVDEEEQIQDEVRSKIDSLHAYTNSLRRSSSD